MMTFDQALVVITIAPSLEEAMIDWLLANDLESGFTSMPVFGHGSQHDHLSAAEQVSGRQRRLQFQIQLASVHVEQFLRELREEFKGADLHSWIQPLYTSGK